MQEGLCYITYDYADGKKIEKRYSVLPIGTTRTPYFLLRRSIMSEEADIVAVIRADTFAEAVEEAIKLIGDEEMMERYSRFVLMSPSGELFRIKLEEVKEIK